MKVTAFSKGTTKLKGFSLALLIWSQLAFALHSVEHDELDQIDSCVVCSQYDRDQDVLVLDRVISVPPAAVHSVSSVAIASVPASVPSFFRARASP